MKNLIKIYFSSIDGITKTHSFKTIEGARQFALKVVGEQDVDGGLYAVSDDGVVRITWAGISRAELFAFVEAPRKPLNKTTTFYAKGDNLYCREAGYTHDHANQLFARVVRVLDCETGDHDDGFALRHVNALPLFDECQHYATREQALAVAKSAYISYLAYLANDCP